MGDKLLIKVKDGERIHSGMSERAWKSHQLPCVNKNNGETGCGVKKKKGRGLRIGKMAQNEENVDDKWEEGKLWRARDIG